MINRLNKIFDFYIKACIHVALAVFSLLYLFLEKHQLPYDENLAYTIFYGTIVSYNLVKFLPQKILNRSYRIRDIKFIGCFSIVITALLFFYFLQLPLRTLMWCVIGFVLVLGYAFPLIRKKNFRSFPAMKIYIVAWCWAFVVVLIPAMHYQLDLNWRILLEFTHIFILVVALIIPFDIRDQIYDALQLQTIPQKYGVVKAKLIAIILLLLYGLIEVLVNDAFYHLVVLLPLIIAIKKMPKQPVKYYCSFGIESFPIIILVAYLIMVR